MKKIFGILIVLFIFGCGKKETEKMSSPPTSESKSIVGKLLAANAGDSGCGIDVLGKDGKKTELYATFDICELKVGDIYKFSYGEVDLPDCDGAANCKKTKKVEMIVGATPDKF